MYYTMIEIRCEHCDKKCLASRQGVVIEGEKYAVTCSHCGTKNQFVWGWAHGRLSYALPLGTVLIEFVENNQMIKV